MFVETRYEHVALDEKGTPFIAGTTMKVKELVADHQDEIDRDIKADAQSAEELRQNAKSSPLVARLKAQGLL